MNQWWTVFFTSLLLVCGCSRENAEKRLEPDVGGRGILEVGYWRGEGMGIGGHIWIDLAPFQFEGRKIHGGELDLNRFKIHLPYDLNELNHKSIDCLSDEFSWGPHGSLQIRSPEGEPISLQPTRMEFKRTGNQSFYLTMYGRFDATTSPRSFSISAPLDLQFSYGLVEPHPNEFTIDKAISLVGRQEMPRWCDETYESTHSFGDWTQTFLLLRPHRAKDFQRWKGSFSEPVDLSSAILPQYEVPNWWPVQAHTTMSEPEETDVFFDEETFEEDENGNKVGFGLSVRLPSVPTAPDGPARGNLQVLMNDPESLEIRSLASRNGWIAFRSESDFSGSIFIFHFERGPSLEEKSTE